jgi:hypothetical protein
MMEWLPTLSVYGEYVRSYPRKINLVLENYKSKPKFRKFLRKTFRRSDRISNIFGFEILILFYFDF